MIRLADERLCALAQAGDFRARDELLRRHEGRALVAAAGYYWPGADRDDVRQEARLALYQAVLLYDPAAGASFLTFSRLVIDRALVTGLRAALREKHRVLDEALRVARHPDDGLVQVVDLLPARDGDPVRTLAAREELARLARGMRTLAPLEDEWFRFAVNGGVYSGEVDGRRNKRVENAVQRARDKLRRAA